jgi:catechol-2,3-dioxygenase
LFVGVDLASEFICPRTVGRLTKQQYQSTPDRSPLGNKAIQAKEFRKAEAFYTQALALVSQVRTMINSRHALAFF